MTGFVAQQPLPRNIHAAVDHVLATHGAYVPVELLLATGQLRYTDYQAWRCGSPGSLESALAGNRSRVIATLQQAADWAQTLGLQPAVSAYFGWGEHAHRRLALARDSRSEVAGLLATHYVRAHDAAAGNQLDLFLDSGVTVALQDLRAALRARAPAAAERCLAVLDANAPDHRLRGAALRLLAALRDLATPIPAARAQAELARIEQALLPAARDVLGADARDLMAAFWQRLAAALDHAPFDPERPRLHASHAYAQCLDWPRAAAAVEAVAEHTAHPALLARLARARYHDGDYNGAIAAWCQLCWTSAGSAALELDSLPPTATKLRQIWVDFHALDVDPGPDTRLFPAWLLLAEPGLAHGLPRDLAAGAGAGELAFGAVRRLLRQDSIEARKGVRAAAPWLLAQYLA